MFNSEGRGTEQASLTKLLLICFILSSNGIFYSDAAVDFQVAFSHDLKLLLLFDATDDAVADVMQKLPFVYTL